MSSQALRPIELLNPDKHQLELFDSGIAELDSWLRNTAVIATAANTAATWVLCRETTVVGYYALAMGSVEHTDTPSRLRRGQPNPVPVLLLARLALDRSEQGKGLGADLLRDALLRALVGAKHYGARAVVVDAINATATTFYEHHGFLRLSKRQLYRRVSDIQMSIHQ